MLPRELIASAVVPSTSNPAGQSEELAAGSELRLYQRGEDYSIFVDNWELMNSRATSSEAELARLALAKHEGQKGLRVLVGGLGMGFTLRAALDLVDSTSELLVAELVPEVVEWNRGVLSSLADNPLEDPRVTVRIDDVAQVLRENPRGFDAVMLDVDNGPHSKTGPTEGWLYSRAGLRTLSKALRRPGVATIWSAGPSKFFGENLKAAGMEPELVRSRGSQGKGARFVIWVATRS